MTSQTFFFVFICILALILLAVNIIFAPHNPYNEKNSPFECGFHSFLGQNRSEFTISFFIFALLFLLFDLEILLIYPYVVSAYANGIHGLVIVLIFFLVLTLGFAFELGKKALDITSRQSNSSYVTSNLKAYKSKIIELSDNEKTKCFALGNIMLLFILGLSPVLYLFFLILKTIFIAYIVKLLFFTIVFFYRFTLVIIVKLIFSAIKAIIDVIHLARWIIINNITDAMGFIAKIKLLDIFYYIMKGHAIIFFIVIAGIWRTPYKDITPKLIIGLIFLNMKVIFLYIWWMILILGSLSVLIWWVKKILDKYEETLLKEKIDMVFSIFVIMSFVYPATRCILKDYLNIAFYDVLLNPHVNVDITFWVCMFVVGYSLFIYYDNWDMLKDKNFYFKIRFIARKLIGFNAFVTLLTVITIKLFILIYSPEIFMSLTIIVYLPFVSDKIFDMYIEHMGKIFESLIQFFKDLEIFKSMTVSCSGGNPYAIPGVGSIQTPIRPLPANTPQEMILDIQSGIVVRMPLPIQWNNFRLMPAGRYLITGGMLVVGGLHDPKPYRLDFSFDNNYTMIGPKMVVGFIVTSQDYAMQNMISSNNYQYNRNNVLFNKDLALMLLEYRIAGRGRSHVTFNNLDSYRCGNQQPYVRPNGILSIYILSYMESKGMNTDTCIRTGRIILSYRLLGGIYTSS